MVDREQIQQESLESDTSILDEFSAEVSTDAPLPRQGRPLDILIVFVVPEKAQQIIEVAEAALDGVDLLVTSLLALRLNDVESMPEYISVNVLSFSDQDRELLLT